VVPGAPDFRAGPDPFTEWGTHVGTFGTQYTRLSLVSRQDHRLAAVAGGSQTVLWDARQIYSSVEIMLRFLIHWRTVFQCRMRPGSGVRYSTINDPPLTVLAV
jgi:hypothetical protein